MADRKPAGQNVTAPKNTAPKNTAPKNAAPKNTAPKNAAPKNAAPKNAASKNASPKNAASRHAAQRPVVQKSASQKRLVQKANAPKSHVSKFLLNFFVSLFVVVGVGLLTIFIMIAYQKNAQKKAQAELNAPKEQAVVIKQQTLTVEPIDETDSVSKNLLNPTEKETEKTESVEEELTEEPEVLTKYGEILQDQEYLTANHIYPKEAVYDDSFTMTFAGDILFDSGYAVMNALRQNGGALEQNILPEVLEILRGSDLTMVNNEFPYSDRGTPTPEKQFTFRASPSTAPYLQDMGADIVSLANNHAYDYGEQALLDTFETLENIGMPYVGAGRNIDEAMRPVYFILNDIKVGFLSATQIERLDNPDTKAATESSAGVFRCWNNKRLLEQIREVKNECDFLVVYIHWGTEGTDVLDQAQTQQAPQMAEAGADLIIGDHPHVLQSIATVQGVPVIYSLGNFWFNSKTMDTGMFQVTVGAEGIQKLQFIPCLQSGCRTSLLQGEEKNRVLDYMRSISGGVTIDDEGYIYY